MLWLKTRTWLNHTFNDWSRVYIYYEKLFRFQDVVEFVGFFFFYIYEETLSLISDIVISILSL